MPCRARGRWEFGFSLAGQKARTRIEWGTRRTPGSGEPKAVQEGGASGRIRCYMGSDLTVARGWRRSGVGLEVGWSVKGDGVLRAMRVLEPQG